MAMRLGTENKRQVYLVIALFAVIAVAGGVELYQTLSGPSTTPRPAATQTRVNNRAAAGTQGAAPEAQRISFASIDPVLHFGKLAQSEDVEYKGTGRNIFSAESAPPVIPQPIKSARQNQTSVTLPPPVPQPPAIDLKYFGYSEVNGGQPQAYFVHGDDVFLAKSGDVVDHRYKVDAVNPTSAKVTDLGYNNTQTLNIEQN